jgi:hypothetical protein
MADKFGWGDVGRGGLVVASGAGAGALIGAATEPPPNPDAFDLGLRPVYGAVAGGALTAMGGLVVAATSKKYRNLGLGTASAMGIWIAAALVKKAISPSKLTGSPS